MRPRIASAIVAAVALIVLALAASALAASQATHPKLLGVVGKNDAFNITLTNKGKSVKTLKAGTYTFVVQDDSTIHNYELDGPNGKSWKFTSVGFKGTKTITSSSRRASTRRTARRTSPSCSRSSPSSDGHRCGGRACSRPPCW
jgi:hypothetical protein